MAIFETLNFKTEGVGELPSKAWWRLGANPPTWNSLIKNLIQNGVDFEIPSLSRGFDHELEQFPPNISTEKTARSFSSGSNSSSSSSNFSDTDSNSSTRTHTDSVGSIVSQEFSNTDIDKFYSKYERVLNGPTENVVKYLESKSRQYNERRARLDTHKAALNTGLDELNASFITRFFFRGTIKKLNNELHAIEREQQKLNQNHLLVAGVTARYVNKNHNRLTPTENQILSQGISPLLEVKFKANPDTSILKDSITQLVSKTENPKNRILFACEYIRASRENNDPILRQKAVDLFRKELNELAISRHSPVLSACLDNIRILVSHNNHVTEEQLDALRNLKSLMITASDLNNTLKDFVIIGDMRAKISVEDIFDYVLGNFGLERDSRGAADLFLKNFQNIIADKKENTHKIANDCKDYKLLRDKILPAIVDGYDPKNDDTALISGLKEQMTKHQDFAINKNFIGTDAQHQHYNHAKKCRQILSELRDLHADPEVRNTFWSDDNEKVYIEFTREYYRSLMRKLYENKTENEQTDKQLEEIIDEICDVSDVGYRLLPKEDKKNIQLMLALAGKTSDLSRMLVEDFKHEFNAHQCIIDLNKYLYESKNPVTESVAAKKESNDPRLDPTYIEVAHKQKPRTPKKSKGSDKPRDNSRVDSGGSSSSVSNTGEKEYNCQKLVVTQCKHILDKGEGILPETYSKHRTILLQYDADAASQYAVTNESATMLAISAAIDEDSRLRTETDTSTSTKSSSSTSTKSSSLSTKTRNIDPSIRVLLRRENEIAPQKSDSFFSGFFWGNSVETEIKNTVELIEKMLTPCEAFLTGKGKGSKAEALEKLEPLKNSLNKLHKLCEKNSVHDGSLLKQIAAIHNKVLAWHEYGRYAIDSKKIDASDIITKEEIKAYILDLPHFDDMEIVRCKIAMNPEYLPVAQLGREIQAESTVLDAFQPILINGNIPRDPEVRITLIEKMASLFTKMVQYQKMCVLSDKTIPDWFNEQVELLEEYKEIYKYNIEGNNKELGYKSEVKRYMDMFPKFHDPIINIKAEQPVRDEKQQAALEENMCDAMGSEIVSRHAVTFH